MRKSERKREIGNPAQNNKSRKSSRNLNPSIKYSWPAPGFQENQESLGNPNLAIAGVYGGLPPIACEPRVPTSLVATRGSCEVGGGPSERSFRFGRPSSRMHESRARVFSSCLRDSCTCPGIFFGKRRSARSHMCTRTSN